MSKKKEKHGKLKKNEGATLMLDRLALGRWGSFGHGSSHEHNEFLGTTPLEIAELAHVACVGQDHRINGIALPFHYQKSRYLHPSPPFSFTLFMICLRALPFPFPFPFAFHFTLIILQKQRIKLMLEQQDQNQN